MDFVTGHVMAQTMIDLGAYGIVNRFSTEPVEAYASYGIAIGVKDPDKSIEIIDTLQPESVCLDVAHGHHSNVVSLIHRIRYLFPGVWIIAGNVATLKGADFLAANGADAIRVGIGPGSACSTRDTTGIGVPQLTAIMDTAMIKEKYPKVTIIADGGIQKPGDIAKALVAGADAVMLGKMLAGHDESPGDILDWNGVRSKRYRGQSLLGTNGERKAPEGVEGHVPYRGPVKDTIDSLTNYLKSSFSYVGARNFVEFKERAEFIKVSLATLKENKTRV